MSRKQTTLLGWLVPVVIVGLVIAWGLSRGNAPQRPANFPAAKQEAVAGGQPAAVPGAVTERAAGGQLERGQWQFGYVPDHASHAKIFQARCPGRR
jgi:hypothetical protein